MTTCLNCQHTFDRKYCNECGQKATTKRYTVGSVMHDLPHAVFHVDKGILKNILSMRNPGKSVREYLQGKRAGYFSPIFLFLLSTGLILFIEHLFHKNIEFNLTTPTNTGEFSGRDFIGHYFKYIYFASGFVLALPALMLFRRETGYNYAEQVVASVFILGYTNILYLVFVFLPMVTTFPLNLFVLVPFYIFTVLVYYRGKLWLTLLKSLLSVALQIIFFFLFSMICVALLYSFHLMMNVPPSQLR